MQHYSAYFKHQWPDSQNILKNINLEEFSSLFLHYVFKIYQCNIEFVILFGSQTTSDFIVKKKKHNSLRISVNTSLGLLSEKKCA